MPLIYEIPIGLSAIKGGDMKILDLFCGTKSVSRAFEARGHEVYTVDWEK